MGPDRAATGGTTPESTAFLPLAQVLEEEFVALHGPLPASTRGLDPGARIPAVYEAIHALNEKRSALCLSGGGIRSATFALGVLQGLARAGLLTQFHYLSTVSGGGYIGSWLSAWIHRSGDDAEKVAAQLASLRPRAPLDPEPGPALRPVPEPDPWRSMPLPVPLPLPREPPSRELSSPSRSSSTSCRRARSSRAR